MNALPVFGDESRLPRAIAELPFDSVQHYPDPKLGVSIRYGSAFTAKADVYLYDMGLSEIPSDLKSDQVMDWFQESVQGVFLAAEQGLYQDFELLKSQYLHLPPDAEDPFCLWAAFSYTQAPGPATAFTGPRVSNIALRTDRGFINKLRYTYPAAAGDEGLFGFLRFLVEWTAAVQQFPVGEG